jgi:RimJ/RimL family protein N-acetyltransferase
MNGGTMITEGKIRLRAPERSDLPNFVRWMNDPEVTAGLLVVLPLSAVDEEKWFENMQNRPQTEHPLVIETPDADGRWLPVGNSGFHNLDMRVRSAEVGLVIGEKEYWNQGLGSAVMRLLLRHGFETLNLNRIYLHVFANNPRAIRCYEKVGFVHEGRLRQDMYKNGQYIDVLVMSVLREEWKP